MVEYYSRNSSIDMKPPPTRTTNPFCSNLTKIFLVPNT